MCIRVRGNLIKIFRGGKMGNERLRGKVMGNVRAKFMKCKPCVLRIVKIINNSENGWNFGDHYRGLINRLL